MGEISNVLTVQVPEMNKPSTRLEQGVHVYYLWLYIIMNIIIVQILTRKQSVLIHH